MTPFRPAWPTGVELLTPVPPDHQRVLTPQALAFVAELTRKHRGRVQALLEARQARQSAIDQGTQLDFLSETLSVRQGDWKAAALPPDLQDRRVEITGPPVRKMIINALNSGANVFMADFEDSCAPTWDNLIVGQGNLMDAVRGTIRVDDPHKTYTLADTIATLMVRPRGWHLWERHLRVDDGPVPGALVDFGLYFFHNAQALLKNKTGPYFYLPKMQSYHEAALWSTVFEHAESALGVPHGKIRATVLIETLPAAFEMDEIIHALKDYIAGLNCGRWDYIFSYIKTHRATATALLPDRSLVGMTQPCMRAYSQLLIRTCHRRGVHAMGGMAAQIPIKGDKAANDAAMQRVVADKLREVHDGHDGTWVAHPALVPVAKGIFDTHMTQPNQIANKREDVQVMGTDLLRLPEGARTVAGLRHNIEVGVRYLAAWLAGNGCVPIHHLMEDAATAEISRSQVWQWLKYGATLQTSENTSVTLNDRLFTHVVDEEMDKIHREMGATGFAEGHFHRAREMFEQLSRASLLDDFLTVAALPYLDVHSTNLDSVNHP